LKKPSRNWNADYGSGVGNGGDWFGGTSEDLGFGLDGLVDNGSGDAV